MQLDVEMSTPAFVRDLLHPIEPIMSSFLHRNTASLGTSLVLTLIELQQGKFLIFKKQSHCICFMKIYITDRFCANFGQNRVGSSCGKFPILIYYYFPQKSNGNPGKLKCSICHMKECFNFTVIWQGILCHGLLLADRCNGVIFYELQIFPIDPCTNQGVGSAK